MKTAFIIVYTSLVYFISAWAHEGDIQYQCKKHGNAGSAAWHGELVCSPKEQP